MLDERGRPRDVHGMSKEIPPVADREAFSAGGGGCGEQHARFITIVAPALLDDVILSRHIRAARSDTDALLESPGLDSVTTQFTGVVSVEPAAGYAMALGKGVKFLDGLRGVAFTVKQAKIVEMRVVVMEADYIALTAVNVRNWRLPDVIADEATGFGDIRSVSEGW